MKRITNKEITSYVAAKKPFKANSTHAAWVAPRSVYLGRLPHLIARKLVELLECLEDQFPPEEALMYVVYSYGTPIAWYHSSIGWAMPSVKYSSTTSCAQGRVREAISESV